MNSDFGYHLHYRRWHDDSPEHLARMQTHFGGLLGPHLPVDREVPVLDVGCGMGFALEALRARGFTNLSGVERDFHQAEAARSRGFTVECLTDTTAWLRERPERYGLVLLLDVLEHVPRAEQFAFLTALHGALRPGGRLICSVPNANSTFGMRQRYLDWTHEAGYNEYSLEFVLRGGGFRQLQILADDGPAKPLPWLPLWRRRWWYVRGGFRLIRRLQLMAEIGPQEGRAAILSLNLLAVATK